MSPNTVAQVLDEMGVRYERDLDGFVVGALRLERAGGAPSGPWCVRSGATNGPWCIRSVRGPELRTRSVNSRTALRTLVIDYFPRWSVRLQRCAYGFTNVETERAPRRLNPDGTERAP